MKILIGMCTGGQVQAQTVASLIGALDQLKKYAGNLEYKVSIQIGGDKAQNMNRLARETVEGKFEYLMSIDADMVFPADGIIKLIENDKDIVGANYAVRGNAVDGHAGEAVIKIADKNGKRINIPLSELPDKLFPCNALGNGFILYKAKVFKDIPAPWFKVTEDKDGNWGGEDVLFHEVAQKAGFEMWCNPKIHMGHIGTFNYEI